VNEFRYIEKFLTMDSRLTACLDEVRECAKLYLMAKQRQKGCDGMGKVATLEDDFTYSLGGLILYCQEKGYLSGEIPYESEAAAREVCRIAAK
jgi:hypothetical protein